MLGVSGSFTHVNWPHLYLTTKKDGKVFDRFCDKIISLPLISGFMLL